MRKLIAYFRVSTTKQGASGLGLEAQKAAVTQYVTTDDTIVESYTEVESGRNCERPQLRKAIDHCRLTGATLLIAKLDRLSRRVSFLSALMDSDVQFVAADNPHATRFTLHILAAVAEHEAEAISLRTKAALAAAKAKGTKLGGDRGRRPTAAQQRHAVRIKQERAHARCARILPVIAELRQSGAGTLRQLAARLNERGITAPRGGEWSAAQVSRVLARAA